MVFLKDQELLNSWGFLQPEQVAPAIEKVKKLNEIAKQRGQSLAQMALVWLLKDKRVTSVLIGASSIPQLDDNVAALNNRQFSKSELEKIEQILSGETRNVTATILKESKRPVKTEGNNTDNTPSRGDFMAHLASKLNNRK